MKGVALPAPATLAARSFNMERLKAATMFGRTVPKRLKMPITFIETTGNLTDTMVTEFLSARKIMQAVLTSGLLDPKNFGLQVKIEPIILLDVNPTNLIRYHLPSMWLYKEFYLQASYYNPKKVTSTIPYHATSAAQTFYDIMCERHLSLDPAQHQPIQQSFRQVRELNLTIGDFYEAEIGVWCRDLLEYHTAALVMLRAAWMGRNAGQEYQKFTAAGGAHFSQYPALCP
jgi:hypothetical protein